jgi:hypothetical protein
VVLDNHIGESCLNQDCHFPELDRLCAIQLVRPMGAGHFRISKRNLLSIAQHLIYSDPNQVLLKFLNLNSLNLQEQTLISLHGHQGDFFISRATASASSITAMA